MHPIVARIALLAYLVGGLVVPAIHGHASYVEASPGLHACGSCDAGEDSETPNFRTLAVEPGASVGQTADHHVTCDEACAVCAVAKAGQQYPDRGGSCWCLTLGCDRPLVARQPTLFRTFLDPVAPRGPPIVTNC